MVALAIRERKVSAGAKRLEAAEGEGEERERGCGFFGCGCGCECVRILDVVGCCRMLKSLSPLLSLVVFTTIA
jgi:hypothetical protein